MTVEGPEDERVSVADVAEVASAAEEAVKKFTISASKASTVFTIDLAELRRMRIQQGKTPGISKYLLFLSYVTSKGFANGLSNTCEGATRKLQRRSQVAKV